MLKNTGGELLDIEEKIAKWKLRDYSWSQHSSFLYSPEQWFERYISGKETDKTPELEYGSKTGKSLETDKEFMPHIPRQKVMEYELRAIHDHKVIKRKISLVGYADSFCDDTLILEEYKTGVKKWDQKRADEHGQITMYLYILWLSKKIQPHNVFCRIHWIETKKIEHPTFEVEIKETGRTFTFKTYRSMRQVILFANEINETILAMEQYAINHK